MLLADFKAISEIDTQISTLHKHLEDLYATRAKVLGESGLTGQNIIQPKPATRTANNRAKLTYDKLAKEWQKCGITLPRFSILKKRLQTAEQLAEHLSKMEPRLQNKLTIVAVPPYNILNLHTYQSLLLAKNPNLQPAVFAEGLTPIKRTSSWRIVLVYCEKTGIQWGSAKEIMDNKKYVIAGQDMRGLGLQEYMAFTLLQKEPVDESSWTWLLKNHRKGIQQAPSVAFIGGTYHFELDDEVGLFEEEYFRPAVEIT